MAPKGHPALIMNYNENTEIIAFLYSAIIFRRQLFANID